MAGSNSADLERSGAIALTLSPFPSFLIPAEGSLLRTDDRRIPVSPYERIRAELTPEQRQNNVFGGDPFGIVPNTFVKTKDFGIGFFIRVGQRLHRRIIHTVFFRVRVRTIPKRIARCSAGACSLNVRKDQYNMRSSIVDPLPWFSVANLKFVYTDYKHDEIDNETVGATFKTKGVDSRIELVHQPIGLFEGSIGSQIFYKKLSVLGGEAFLFFCETLSVAGFVFEEVKLNPVRLQFGVRVEHDSVSIDSSDPDLTSLTSPGQKDQEFWPISGAAGAIYDFAEGWQLALNLNYSERAPTPEELFARGPHDATFQFIIGDPNLDVEKNRSVDLSLRKTHRRRHRLIGGFYTSYDGFIDFAPTGAFEEGLQVFIYTPKKATFYGGEARGIPSAALEHTKARERPIQNRSKRYHRREETTQTNRMISICGYKPTMCTRRIAPASHSRASPLRYSASLNYESEHWTASIEGWRVDSQDRVAQFETTTPGYTFLNVSLGYKFQWGAPTIIFTSRNNLTDEGA